MMQDQPQPAEAGTAQHAELRESLRLLARLARGGAVEEAEQGLLAIVEAARTAEHPDLVAQGLYRLSYIRDLRGDYYTAAEQLREALRLAVAHGLKDLSAACHFARARQLMLRGRLREAEESLDIALAQAHGSASPRRMGDAYALHAQCCYWLGRLDDSLSYIQEALTHLQAHPGSSLLHTLAFGMSVARQLGQDELADSYARQAAKLSAVTGYPQVISEAAASQSIDLLTRQQMAAARELLDRAEALAGAGSPGLWLLLARAKWAESLQLFDESELLYADAQRVAHGRQSRCEIAWIRVERVAGLIASGALEQAHSILTDAELASEHFGALLNLGRCFCGWVRYFIARGNRVAAAGALARAESAAAHLHGAVGIQFGAELEWSRTAVSSDLPMPDLHEPPPPPPLLHPASTLQ